MSVLVALAACGKKEQPPVVAAPAAPAPTAEATAPASPAAPPAAAPSAAPAPKSAPASAPAKAKESAPSDADGASSVKQVVLTDKLDSAKNAVGKVSTFGRKDTVYAVVDYAGSGPGTLKAVWTKQGNGKPVKVAQTRHSIPANGDKHSHSFFVKKSKGWQKGNYQVEVFLNDKSVSKQKFTVK